MLDTQSVMDLSLKLEEAHQTSVAHPFIRFAFVVHHSNFLMR
jgi:hypothetical protein